MEGPASFGGHAQPQPSSRPLHQDGANPALARVVLTFIGGACEFEAADHLEYVSKDYHYLSAHGCLRPLSLQLGRLTIADFVWNGDGYEIPASSDLAQQIEHQTIALDSHVEVELRYADFFFVLFSHMINAEGKPYNIAFPPEDIQKRVRASCALDTLAFQFTTQRFKLPCEVENRGATITLGIDVHDIEGASDVMAATLLCMVMAAEYTYLLSCQDPPPTIGRHLQNIAQFLINYTPLAAGREFYERIAEVIETRSRDWRRQANEFIGRVLHDALEQTLREAKLGEGEAGAGAKDCLAGITRFLALDEGVTLERIAWRVIECVLKTRPRLESIRRRSSEPDRPAAIADLVVDELKQCPGIVIDGNILGLLLVKCHETHRGDYEKTAVAGFTAYLTTAARERHGQLLGNLTQRYATAVAEARVRCVPMLARLIRDAIDEHLLTVNAFSWMDQCNKPGTYQYFASGVLSSILKFRTHSDLIEVIVRRLHRAGVDAKRRASLVLQWGIGRCQEHAEVTFHVLKAMMENDLEISRMFQHVVMVGYHPDLLDHAFCLIGARPLELMATERSGLPIWSLHRFIELTRMPVWVCDPYRVYELDPPLHDGLQLCRYIDRLHEHKGGSPEARALLFVDGYSSAPEEEARGDFELRYEPIACPGLPHELTAIVARPKPGDSFAWKIVEGDAVLRGANGEDHAGGSRARLVAVGGDVLVEVIYYAADEVLRPRKRTARIHVHEVQLDTTAPELAGAAIELAPPGFGSGSYSLKAAHDVAFEARCAVRIRVAEACPQKARCAQNHRAGWLQTLRVNERRGVWGPKIVEVDVPLPIRDAVDARDPPWYDTNGVRGFTGDGDEQVLRIADIPGLRDWSAMREGHALTSLKMHNEFTCWLVVQNVAFAGLRLTPQEHERLDPRALSFTHYLLHIDWKVDVEVSLSATGQPTWVKQDDRAARVTGGAAGKGPHTPSLGDDIANLTQRSMQAMEL